MQHFCGNNSPVKIYRKRWVVLGLFMAFTSLSLFQGIQYAIITNVLMTYYNVSEIAVYWSAIVFMVVWPIFVYPLSFIVHKKGLRVAALIGVFTTTLGAAVKLLSIGRDKYYVVLIGQTFAAISEMITFIIPSKIAVTWFPPDEVSTACALSIFAINFGYAVGFLVPPIIVKERSNIDDTGTDLKTMCWGLAIFCIPVATSMYFFFPKQPEYAPSLAQHYARKKNEYVNMGVFKKSVKEIMNNKPFLLHLISFSFNFGIHGVVTALLNQLVLSYFEGAQEDAGCMGLLLVTGGMISVVIIGRFLDKTHRYKESAIMIYILCGLSLGGFLFALEARSKWASYVTIGFFGMFLNGYIPIGYELAVELTYPSPESIVNGILLCTSQIFATIFTTSLGYVHSRFGAFHCILAQIGIFVFGFIITCITPNKLNRQEAFRNATPAENEQLQIIDPAVTNN